MNTLEVDSLSERERLRFTKFTHGRFVRYAGKNSLSASNFVTEFFDILVTFRRDRLNRISRIN